MQGRKRRRLPNTAAELASELELAFIADVLAEYYVIAGVMTKPEAEQVAEGNRTGVS
jgi:hypothetical protein